MSSATSFSEVFHKEFTPSYIALCHTEAIYRDFVEGDWYYEVGTTTTLPCCYGMADSITLGSRSTGTPPPGLLEWVWLPRLDQLIDLLEVRGVSNVVLYKGEDHRWTANEYVNDWYDNWADSREEATLMLLKLVRDR